MRKTSILGIILVLLLLPVIDGYLYTSNYIKGWNGRICPRCVVNGVDISGRSWEEAVALLKDSISYMYGKEITIKNGDKTYSIRYEDLSPRYNIEDVVEEEMQYGAALNMFNKVKLIKDAVERRHDLKFEYDDKPIHDLINRLEKEINRSPQDASIKLIRPGKIVVQDEINGIRLDRESLYNDIISNIDDDRENPEVNIKLEQIRPALTGEILRRINKRIASFSTYYGSSAAGRAANIEITTSLINGKLVMPGETFSFNETTGPRVQSAGYQTAPVIIKNKLVDGIGGGVCQVSTTLYNAVVQCGLKSLQRLNHSLAPAYVPPGFDATVASYIDYKFRNTLNYPILIEGFTKKGHIYFNIYSNSAVSKIKYKLENDIYEEEKPEIVYKNDPTLPAGKIEKEESPHTGYKVKVYLIGYKKGKEISRQLISHDVYKKVDGVFRVGEGYEMADLEEQVP